MMQRRWFRYLLDVIGFLVVLAAFEYGAQQPIMLETFGAPSAWGTLQDSVATLNHFSETELPDIIVVGSSVSQNSIVPRNLSDSIADRTGEEFSIVNVGANWLSADIAPRFVVDVMPSLHTPRMILYPLFPLDLLPTTSENQTLRLKNSTFNEVWFYDAPLIDGYREIAIRSDWLQYSQNISDWIAGVEVYTPITNWRGYAYRDEVHPDIEAVAAFTMQPQIRTDSYAAQQLAEMLTWAEDHDIYVVLFSAPLPYNYRQSESGQQNMQTMTQHLKNVAAAHPNVIYLDLYADDFRVPPSGFRDETHTNYEGALAWTERLAEMMVRENVLEWASVGIVRVYGDNQVVIFYRETAGVVEVYSVLPDLYGSFLHQWGADEWQSLPLNAALDVNGDGWRLRLTRLEDDNAYRFEFWGQDDHRLTDTAFIIPVR